MLADKPQNISDEVKLVSALFILPFQISKHERNELYALVLYDI
jgi:hypothetical protein